jgi:pimeloyl-ACP methyl ester carboxylesterase
MTNNFLISVRNRSGLGRPGLQPGSPACIEIRENEPSYNLLFQLKPPVWLSHISGPSVLVFVHGFGNNAEKVVERHNTIKPHLPSGVSLVSFDWPSGNLYAKDKDNAKATADKLIGYCLQPLADRFGAANVHLFGHSMGAFVTEMAFQATDPTTINHVMLAAADVDRLNYRAASPSFTSFLNHCNDLTVYWSQEDEALKASAIDPYNNGTIPLGLKGFPEPAVPERCQSVECTGYYLSYVKDSPPPNDPSPEEFSHVWYLLYQSPPPRVNDFYVEVEEILRGLPTDQTRTQRGYQRLRASAPDA